MGSGCTSGGLIALCLMVATSVPALAECSDTTVELRSGDKVARFSVELADTGEERAFGLMNRKRMSASAGMLFVYETPVHASFWMKNTLIPLDMIFVDKQGLVTKVHPCAKPFDETAIDGGDGVAFVLEINGGLADRLGIAAGSQLRHTAVDQATAVWSCGSE